VKNFVKLAAVTHATVAGATMNDTKYTKISVSFEFS